MTHRMTIWTGTGLAVLVAGGVLWHYRGRWITIAALSLLAGAGGAQPVRPPGEFPAILEDWGCGQAVEVSNASPAVVTCSSPHGLPATMATGQAWIFHFSGATGAWDPLNGQFPAVIIDKSHFSIPVDTRGFGPFQGQQVNIIRGNYDNAVLWTSAFAGHDGVKSRVLPEGNALEVTIPNGYTSTANLMNCYATTITSFIVKDGMASVTLQKPMFNESPSYVIAPGREIHFRNLDNPLLNSTRYTGRGKDQPHYINWVNDKFTELRAPVKVPDGTYQSDNPKLPGQVLVCPKLMYATMFVPRSALGYPMPTANASAYAKGGPFDPKTNRMYMWIKTGKRIARRADNGYNSTIGTYAKALDDPDPRMERFHFYHQIDPNFYAGQWMHIILNNQPQHARSVAGNVALPFDPMREGWGYYSAPLWDGRVSPYLANLTSFYIDTGHRLADFSGETVLFGPVVMDYVESEPDSYVSSITTVYDSNRFANRGPGYEVGFYAAKNGKDLYDIRYSTQGSLKKNGFSSGKDGGKLQGSGGPYNDLMWYSPKMEEQEVLWVGIRPHMRIAGVSKAGVSPIVISLWHESTVTGPVSITEVSGNTAANRARTQVKNVPGSFWSLERGLVGIRVEADKATITLKTPHGLQAGQVVEVFDTPNPALGRAAWQRFYTVQETPTPTTFTIRTQGVPDGEYAVDAGPTEKVGVHVLPAVIVDGVGSGEYGGAHCSAQKLCEGGGLVTPLDEHNDFTEVPVFRFDQTQPVRDQIIKYRSAGEATPGK